MPTPIELTPAQRRAITCNYRTLDQLAEMVHTLLESRPRTKTNLVILASTNGKRMKEILDALLAKGIVENFEARGDRGRIEEFWCLAGRRPENKSRFKADEILEGFRRAAFGLPAA